MVQYRDANLDRVAAAIADSTRRAILAHLANGPAPVSEVAVPFRMSLTGFCKHIRVLERAGLVRSARRGRCRMLALRPEPLRQAADWLLQYEPFWNERLDRLEAHFKAKRKERS